MPRFAANVSMLFTERPFLERFGAAARAGFRAVEMQLPYAWPAREVAGAAAEHGLEVVLLNAPAGDWDRGERGLACLPERAAEVCEGVAQAAEYARALRCPRVHLMAGIRPGGVPAERAREAYVAAVRHAAEELGRDGVAVMLEAINDRDMPGYFLTSTRQALDVIEEVGAPNVRFQLDAYHLAVMGEDLGAAIAAAGDRLGHVQIADAPGRGEPGTGAVDFPRFFGQLAARRWDGWIGCEYRPRGGTEAGLSWLASYGGREEGS